MRLTPIDIAHKIFNKKMMGYDTDQVTDFLQQVASAMEALIHERNTLRESLREKEMQLADFKERDKMLKETINTAAHMSDKLRLDSEREGKLIIADAQQKADIILRDSRDSLKKMYQEISDLKRVRMQFEANLKAIAQAHLTLLEQGEKYMPQVQLPVHNFAGIENGTATGTTVGAANGNTGAGNGGLTSERSTGISPLTSGY